MPVPTGSETPDPKRAGPRPRAAHELLGGAGPSGSDSGMACPPRRHPPLEAGTAHTCYSLRGPRACPGHAHIAFPLFLMAPPTIRCRRPMRPASIWQRPSTCSRLSPACMTGWRRGEGRACVRIADGWCSLDALYRLPACMAGFAGSPWATAGRYMMPEGLDGAAAQVWLPTLSLPSLLPLLWAWFMLSLWFSSPTRHVMCGMCVCAMCAVCAGSGGGGGREDSKSGWAQGQSRPRLRTTPPGLTSPLLPSLSMPFLPLSHHHPSPSLPYSLTHPHSLTHCCCCCCVSDCRPGSLADWVYHRVNGCLIGWVHAWMADPSLILRSWSYGVFWLPTPHGLTVSSGYQHHDLWAYDVFWLPTP